LFLKAGNPAQDPKREYPAGEAKERKKKKKAGQVEHVCQSAISEKTLPNTDARIGIWTIGDDYPALKSPAGLPYP
jgi:hypothetical protein